MFLLIVMKAGYILIKKNYKEKGFTDLDESFLLDSFNNANLIIINDKEILRKKFLILSYLIQIY